MSIPFSIWEIVLIALIALVVGMFILPRATATVTQLTGAMTK